MSKVFKPKSLPLDVDVRLTDSYSSSATGGGESSSTTKVDVSDTTATANDVIQGKSFHVATGGLVSGTIPLKQGETYTPGTASQVINSGVYLNGEQVILGDTDLVAENIKKDVTIFGVTGSYQGGTVSGAFDLVKVANYVEGWNKINSLTLSGLTDHTEAGGENLTLANGVYNVTPATANLPAKQRIYKHSTQNFYLYFYVGNPETEFVYNSWCLNTNTTASGEEALLYTSNQVLQAGTSNWDSPYGMGDSVTISNIVSEPVAMVLNGYKAISYSGGTWTFSNTLTNYSSTMLIPQVGLIYSATGNTLLGGVQGQVTTLSMEFMTADEILLKTSVYTYKKDNAVKAFGGYCKINGYWHPVLFSQQFPDSVRIRGTGTDTGDAVLYNYHGMSFYMSGYGNLSGGTIQVVAEGLYYAGDFDNDKDAFDAIINHYYGVN